MDPQKEFPYPGLRNIRDGAEAVVYVDIQSPHLQRWGKDMLGSWRMAN